MPKGVGGLKSLFFYCVPQRTSPQRFVSIGLATGSARQLRPTDRNQPLRQKAEAHHRKIKFKADSPPGHATFPQQTHEQAWAKCRTYRDPGSDRGHAAYL